MVACNLNNRALAIFAFSLLIFAAAAHAAPVASAGADQVAAVGQNVTVNGAASTCSGCSIVSYSWNWGDGNTSTGASAVHAYGSATSYTVTLTIVANDSSVSSDTLSVTVQSSDSQAPTITHTNVTNWTINQSIPISATVTDNVGVSTVTLYYKNSSENASYLSTTMSASGSTYTATIPNTSTAANNTSYYITASDTASPANTNSTGSSDSPIVISLSATDTAAPITTLISVSGDTSSPYWVTTSNSTSNNAYVIVSGESGMACRMGQSNSNYSGMTVGYVDCTISGSTANCTSTLAEGNYTRYVACNDTAGNEQNTSQTKNVTFGVDSVKPSAVSDLAATEGTTKISLSWTVPTDATSGLALQKIFRSSDSSCANYSSIQASYSASATAYNDTSVTAGTTYCYYVVGQDAAGNLKDTYTATTAIFYGPPNITAISLTLSGSTLTLAATTNEAASCRYSTSNIGYSSMTTAFSTTGTTSHSTTASGSSGTVTYYVSCADTAGNAMSTANVTNYTFAATTTTPATTTAGSNNAGGSVGGGIGSGSSSSEAETFAAGSESAPTTVESKRTVDYSSGTGISTFKIKVENTGDSPTGPILLKEEIPSRVAATPEDIVFSIQPTRFETGSIIAVWELSGGIGPGESLTITYSVKKAVNTLTDFKTTIEKLVAAAPEPAPSPSAPPEKQNQTPAKPPEPTAPAAGPAATSPPPSGGKPTSDFVGLILGGGFLLVMAAVVIAIAAYLLFFHKKRKGL